jgi:hypothetical protein
MTSKPKKAPPVPPVHIQSCTFSGSSSADLPVTALAKAIEAMGRAAEELAVTMRDRSVSGAPAIHIGNVGEAGV